jgi:hypothetical protein
VAQLSTLGGIARELLYATLSVRLNNKHHIMKTYNTKLAVLVFTIIIALDVMMYSLWHVGSGGWLVLPWLAVNLPAFPLFHWIDQLGQAGSSGAGFWLLVSSVIISASVWSVIAGFVFRKKYAA